jgi:predicted transcriptional regulator
MNLTLSVDDEIVRQVRRIAEATGTSVNQLVRDYLAQLAGSTDHEADAREIERLSSIANGNSRGWKFNREEIYERR